MFAILITTENIPKICEVQTLTLNEIELLNEMSGKNRYFIRGYVPKRGGLVPWIFLPGYLFESVFEYDPDKIQTDWDQIVRLEPTPS